MISCNSHKGTIRQEGENLRERTQVRQEWECSQMEKLLINLLARSMQIGNNKFIRHQKKYRMNEMVC